MNDQIKSRLGNGFIVRAADREDLEPVVNVINSAALNDRGIKVTTVEDKLIEWGLPLFNLKTDSLLVQNTDGRIVGYVELWDSEPHVRHVLRGYVHPRFREQGIGAYLVKWAEARAQESMDMAPENVRISIHTTVDHKNRAAQRLFELADYKHTRCFFRMLIEMEPGVPPPEPVWPAGIIARGFRLGQDDRAAHRTLDLSFQDHWGYVEGETFEEWIHWIKHDEAFDPSLCFMATTQEAGGEQIIGVLMARPQWEQESSIAWIDEMGVLREWRRRGIGTALLHQVFGAFHMRGQYRVGLNVDGDSLTGATRIYEQVGMHVFQQSDVYAKDLRPGLDLSIQTLSD